MNKAYTLGLDIGTNSIGFSAIDDQYIPMRAKGKTVIGVRLFKEGQPAADTRMFRTTRRRLARRKWRLGLLNQIFEPYVAEVDSTFLRRLKNSSLSNQEDRREFTGSLLFPDKSDQKYFEEYPTIYHLRQKMMIENRQFDIREVYLAIHHIVKYRGNFLNGAPVSQFSVNDMELGEQFERLNVLFNNIGSELQINSENATAFKNELTNQDVRKLDRQRDLKDKLAIDALDKQIQKDNKRIATEIVKAWLGYKFKLDVILGEDVEEPKEWQLNFEDEEIDSKLDDLSASLNNDELEIIDVLKNIYSQVTLAAIVPEGMGLSDSMVEKYEQHRKDLVKYKQLIDTLDKKHAMALKDAYSAYVGSIDGEKVSSRDDFYSAVKKNLDDSELSTEIAEEIEFGRFMPKQRTSDNGVIPHQLHQLELDQIIENQSKYYPFLAELNPNKNRQKIAKYKLDELVTFRIPYYVGPMITLEDQKTSSGAEFAWMKRKESGQITPWNFDDKVDRMESANNFIRRMTTKDSYLIAEDVLPDESLLYQKFKVLNELNLVKADNCRLSVSEKQHIFEGLFKQQNNVTVKQLQNFLVSSEKYLKKPKIDGLSDPKKFNNTLSSYHSLKKIFPDKIDNPDYQHDFENIIEWSTVFEDRTIFAAKLKEINWLTDDQVRTLSTMRSRGWGKLSKKLLTGIRNDNGESIMDILWNTNNNFMQAQADPDIAQQIHQENSKDVKPDDLEAVLDDAYTSPQNKKAIRQVVKVVQDVVKAIGYAPEKIAIEFTRSDDANPRRTKSRYNQMLETFESTAKEIVDDGLKNELIKFADKKKMTDKYVLYFSQLGKDMYTGLPINIDDLNSYDIDHVLPQAFIKDDSLSNRVLVKKAINNAKSDRVPYKEFGQKMGGFWKQLANAGLITKRKLKNLFTDPDSIDKYTAHGFVNRQLVETSQIIRLASNILGNLYEDEGTKIIEIRAKMNSQLREQFDLVKVREVNDYHHAFDAYLTALLGYYLYTRYPKLRPAFVYGDYKTLPDNAEGKWRFNFISPLASHDKIANSDGEIVWDKERNLKLLNDIYGYKFMLVSQEVSENDGALFDQTIYPKSQAGRKKLIPISAGKDTALYGGYSGNKDAYMAIVKIKNKFKVVGVPLRFVDKVRSAQQKGEESYLSTLKKVLDPQFTKTKKNRKTGEIQQVIDDYEIVVPRVLYGQLMIDGTDKFTLGSSTYQYNAKQLVLSKKSMEILDKHRRIEMTDDELVSVFDEIVNKVNRFFSLYDQRKYRETLTNSRDIFTNLPRFNQYEGSKLISKGKYETILDILNGLHANATITDLKHLGIKSPFGKLQSSRGIQLSENTRLIYQSLTGLFERTVKLSDL